MASTGLSTGGKVFFGSLCAGTFGLGCWQIKRLGEKMDKVEGRSKELQMPPITTDWKTSEHPYRRRLLQGTFRHGKEVLVGPRGAPVGVTLPRQGLSAKGGGGGQSAGMAPGPQGYHVLTPLELIAPDSPKSVVWINRGWVPKTMVPGNDKGQLGTTSTPQTGLSSWSRPKGSVNLTTIRSTPESESFTYCNYSFFGRRLTV
jgi:surfeit locus 1 family protein